MTPGALVAILLGGAFWALMIVLAWRAVLIQRWMGFTEGLRWGTSYAIISSSTEPSLEHTMKFMFAVDVSRDTSWADARAMIARRLREAAADVAILKDPPTNSNPLVQRDDSRTIVALGAVVSVQKLVLWENTP